MKWLITGGAGFIGCNASIKLMGLGHDVIILDNLSRAGSEKNLLFLKEAGKVNFIKGDVRDSKCLEELFMNNHNIDVVLHLAAQVAVTTSISNPREDFEINALGTFNILEIVRQFNKDAIVIYSSTNKVYGSMDDIKIKEIDGCYAYSELRNGISSHQPLDFHSPYGCSKGAADQYVIDYSRIYGLKTICFRQSCIYGCHQFGIEDQGWVAWIIICAILGNPITIYGDGKQVRDVLYVDDLVNGYIKAADRIDNIAGSVFNIGGGPNNTMSILELIRLLEKMKGEKLNCAFADWRPGDQKVFICDIQETVENLNWKPLIKKEEGVRILFEWVKKNKHLFS